MTKAELKAYLTGCGQSEALIFADEGKAKAFLGMTADNRAAYSFEGLVQAEMEHGLTYYEAASKIDAMAKRFTCVPSAPMIIYEPCEE